MNPTGGYLRLPQYNHCYFQAQLQLGNCCPNMSCSISQWQHPQNRMRWRRSLDFRCIRIGHGPNKNWGMKFVDMPYLRTQESIHIRLMKEKARTTIRETKLHHRRATVHKQMTAVIKFFYQHHEHIVPVLNIRRTCENDPCCLDCPPRQNHRGRYGRNSHRSHETDQDPSYRSIRKHHSFHKYLPDTYTDIDALKKEARKR